MSNPEHLAELKKGVASWNKWREANPRINPELDGVIIYRPNLSGVDFTRADLSEANIRGANLQGANLQGANLRNTNFDAVNLSNANLTGATLDYADLSYARLNGANLTEAIFYETLLIATELNGADFSCAEIGFTFFIRTDLSSVKGLESCRYTCHSVLDHETLIRSHNLPEVFLRGCGLPDSFIENMPSLVGAIQPIQFYSCFISYSSKDDVFAKRLHADLQAKGVRCWFAPEDMKIGDKIRVRIDEVIRVHDKFLLVLSENSVSSDWVEKEVEAALTREAKRMVNSDKIETILFPIRLDDTVMNIEDGWSADIRRSRHIGDFRQWKDHDQYTKSFDRLLKDLKASAEDENKQFKCPDKIG